MRNVFPESGILTRAHVRVGGEGGGSVSISFREFDARRLGNVQVSRQNFSSDPQKVKSCWSGLNSN